MKTTEESSQISRFNCSSKIKKKTENFEKKRKNLQKKRKEEEAYDHFCILNLNHFLLFIL